MKRFIRWLHRITRERSSIKPMPEGSLLSRCAQLGGWLTPGPQSGMR